MVLQEGGENATLDFLFVCGAVWGKQGEGRLGSLKLSSTFRIQAALL